MEEKTPDKIPCENGDNMAGAETSPLPSPDNSESVPADGAGDREDDEAARAAADAKKKRRREERGKNTAILILVVLCCAILLVFTYLDISFSGDETTDTLISECVSRGVTAAMLAAIAVLMDRDGRKDYRHMFTGKCRDGRPFKAFLWCIPCIAVAVLNFPFSALISGRATIERTSLIALLCLRCLLIALMEEILFRGILYGVLDDALSVTNKKWAGRNGTLQYSNIIAGLISCVVFALCHLFNLFAGANAGDTLLQVGYSFLMGAMFTCVYLKTGNIWMSVLLHAVFDVGGQIVSTLGMGSPHDTTFWIITAVIGVLCAAHVIGYLIMNRPERTKKEQKNGETEE